MIKLKNIININYLLYINIPVGQYESIMLFRLMLLSLVIISANISAEQTIVFMRHGEKPYNNSGQLSCKGLNRALTLPDILLSKFGLPDALFAAAPKQDKLGNSLRSLQTISPTAIQVSLPIHLNYHAKDIASLQKALLSEEYHNALIYVVWEHDNLVKVAKNIMHQQGGDFDSLYVLKINYEQKPMTINFIHQQQNLNTLSNKCLTT